MRYYLSCSERVGIKSGRHNDSNHSIPEEPDFIEVHIIVLLFKVFDLHHPKFVVEQYKDGNDDTRGSATLHPIVPVVFQKIHKGGFFHRVWFFGCLKLIDSLDLYENLGINSDK